MPYLIQRDSAETWDAARSRVLINGAPNMGKTTSLGTFDPPVHVVSVPGEHGTSSIPEGVVGHVFAPIDPNAPRNWQQDWLDTVNECVKIAKDHGPDVTLALDGLHKLYAVAMNVVTKGVAAQPEGDFEAKKYGNAWNLIKYGFLDRVLHLPVRTVVMTCWVELEKDDPDDRSKEAARSLLPSLPGQSATKIMGEFAVVLYAIREGTGAAARYLWYTQPQGKVKACGIKAPLAIASKVPPRVPQDWQILKGHLGLAPNTGERQMGWERK